MDRLSTIHESGVTLIELLIGMGVMALLMALGLPSFSQWMENTRIRNTAESIANGLDLARNEAINRTTPVRFLLDAVGGWTVCLGATAACPTEISNRPAKEGSSGALAVDQAMVVFNSLGQATAGAPVQIDISGAAGTRNLQVNVTGGGLIRMCDPNLPDGNVRKC